MKKKEKRKRKIIKHFIVMNVLILLIVTLTITMIIALGGHYDLRTRYMFEDEYTGTPNVTVSFDKENILAVDNIYLENNELVVSLYSVGSGEVKVAVTSQGEFPFKLTSNFYVTKAGTIFEKLFNSVNFTAYKAVIIEIISVLVLLIGFMCYSFLDCWRKGNFSYPMIAYGGLTMFAALVLALIVYKMMNNVVNRFDDFISVVETSGQYFLLLMLPVMFIMAISVSVSNIRLMRHEGRRPVNALGIAASILWLAGTFLTFFDGIDYLPIRIDWLRDIQTILTYILCYFESMVVSTALCAFLASCYKPPYNKDYIMILGCAIRDDGTPTPLLRGRVDSALKFEKEQFDKTGKHAVFVPSGGQGSDEIISESESMKQYLIKQGIPEERILKEDKSVNTLQNCQFSYKVICEYDEKAEEKNIAFATTNYHIFRGYILSAKNGFRAEGISAKTKWYFFPNAFLREFIGLLFDQKLRHFLFILLIVLFFLAI